MSEHTPTGGFRYQLSGPCYLGLDHASCAPGQECDCSCHRYRNRVVRAVVEGSKRDA